MGSKQWKALFYPHVRVVDQPWMHNALLYWDEIHALAPRGIGLDDFKFPETVVEANKRFADAGVLKTISIDAETPEAMLASDEVRHRLKVDLTHDLGGRLGGGKGSLPTANEKLMYALLEKSAPKLLKRIQKQKRGGTFGHRYRSHYMEALAQHVARSRNLSLVRDTAGARHLASELRVAHKRKTSESAENDILVAHFVIPVPDVRDLHLRDLLAFRRRHQSALGKFRALISELAVGNSDESWHLDWWYDLDAAVGALFDALKVRRHPTSTAVLQTVSVMRCQGRSASSTNAANAILDVVGGGLPFAVDVLPATQSLMRTCGLRQFVLALFDKTGDMEAYEERLGIERTFKK